MAEHMMAQPPGISAKVLEDENLCRRYGGVVTAYDPVSRCGGVYHIEQRQWSLFWPVDLATFGKQAARIAALIARNAEEGAPNLPTAH